MTDTQANTQTSIIFHVYFRVGFSLLELVPVIDDDDDDEVHMDLLSHCKLLVITLLGYNSSPDLCCR